MTVAVECDLRHLFWSSPRSRATADMYGIRGK